jgi:hypothetical protein
VLAKTAVHAKTMSAKKGRHAVVEEEGCDSCARAARFLLKALAHMFRRGLDLRMYSDTGEFALKGRRFPALRHSIVSRAAFRVL